MHTYILIYALTYRYRTEDDDDDGGEHAVCTQAFGPVCMCVHICICIYLYIQYVHAICTYAWSQMYVYLYTDENMMYPRMHDSMYVFLLYAFEHRVCRHA